VAGFAEIHGTPPDSVGIGSWAKSLMTLLMTLHLAFVPGAAGARDDDAKENVFVFFKGFAKASSMSDGLLEPDLASKPLSVGRFSSLLPL
jgi:hypothetical protein